MVVLVPSASAAALVDALSAAGAGQLGDYSRCAWTDHRRRAPSRPAAGSTPTVGAPGERTTAEETRVEMVLPRAAREAVLAALRRAHPYEEPAYQVLELASGPARAASAGWASCLSR